MKLRSSGPRYPTDLAVKPSTRGTAGEATRLANFFDMRRSFILVLVGILLFGSTSLAMGTPKVSRRETKDYMSPAVAVMPVHPTGAAVCNSGGALGGNRGCVDFPILSWKERFLRIEITDASGLPVPAFLAWGEDASEWIPFCGATKKALPVLGGVATVWMYPYRSPNLPLCPGTATTGSVTVTFLKRK